MKTPVPKSLFNKVPGLRPACLLIKETLAQVFFCQFCEIFKNTFLKEHLWTTDSEDGQAYFFQKYFFPLNNT